MYVLSIGNGNKAKKEGKGKGRAAVKEPLPLQNPAYATNYSTHTPVYRSGKQFLKKWQLLLLT